MSLILRKLFVSRTRCDSLFCDVTISYDNHGNIPRCIVNIVLVLVGDSHPLFLQPTDGWGLGHALSGSSPPRVASGTQSKPSFAEGITFVYVEGQLFSTIRSSTETLTDALRLALEEGGDGVVRMEGGSSQDPNLGQISTGNN